MKAALVKVWIRRTIKACRQCVVPQDSIVVTEATLPHLLPLIKKHLKHGDYIAVATPGECYHCHKHADLRCGVCMTCVEKVYTDGIWCWHTDNPENKWAIPKLDRVLERIRFDV